MTDYENDPLLPSGEWEGFYCYQSDGQKHKMDIVLHFSNFRIFGSGIDDVGTFHWNGHYDLLTFKADLVKHYTTHIVHYSGTIDENGIWGIWHIKMDLHSISGGFHIWPKKQYKEQIQAQMKEITSNVQ